MTRRVIKKALRRAEEAIRQERLEDAENIYRGLLNAFSISPPSLLDHAACLYGLISTLAYMQRIDEAMDLSESVLDIIESRHRLLVAA